MRFLLTPVGSGGDVHPFIGIGRALRARGHEVILFSAEPHRKVVEQGDIEFVPTVTTEQYHAATLDPDLWHPRLGVKTVLRMITPALESSFQSVQERYVPGRTMLVGHPLSFHTRTLEDLVGGPAASVQLAPSSIRTSYQMPALPPGIDLSWMPGWMKRVFWVLADRTVDPWILPELNQFRAAHGLAPVRRIFAGWINSPRLTLGLFPDWFGPRQPDWPASFRHASFPLWDDPSGDHIDAELSAFLDRGSPPVVVSPGTANRHASPFFVAATAALTKLGLRGLFLTGYPEQVPKDLPDTIMVRRYAPFSEVLPRAAAFIHHGGIGTLAQGLASGKPQLIMPMAFDQPDNALRATRLGAARWLSPRKFTAERVTAKLKELLSDPGITEAALGIRERLMKVDGVQVACDLLEQQAALK